MFPVDVLPAGSVSLVQRQTSVADFLRLLSSDKKLFVQVACEGCRCLVY
jgi:hypothetical protein